jgi:phenylalanyl-tRNA synthetase beta chain
MFLVALDDMIMRKMGGEKIQSVAAMLLGKDDIILEFELTPNRSDCLNVIGLAREIAPVLNTKLKEPIA